MFSKHSILIFLTWVINIAFWASLIPQMLLNFKLKTTRGLSDAMLYCYFIGYLTYVYYIFCFNLPLSYKVMGPLSFLIVLVIVGQRFLYDQAYKKDIYLLSLYLISGIAGLLLLPCSINNRCYIGNITGWFQVFIWFSYQIPQAIKVHVSKSVFGFSFLLVSLIMLGELIELLIAISLGFPVQTIVNGLRGIIMYLIFCLQFWLYSGEGNA